mmetsp:Transcript_16535/g.35934  ORF Transcript_16535/g.35934 Transcript_16535/m.35934 type:complete len:452 (+) Transcript_16535:111-1466(+)
MMEQSKMKIFPSMTPSSRTNNRAKRRNPLLPLPAETELAEREALVATAGQPVPPSATRRVAAGCPRTVSLCGNDDDVGGSGSGIASLLGTIVCDEDFRIRRCDEGALALLGYSGADIEGSCVTRLMSPLVGRVHRRIFRRVRDATPAQLERVASKLSYSMSNCRDFALIDRGGEPVVCGLSVFLREDRTSTVLLLRVDTKLLHTVPRGFEQYINERPGLHVRDYEGVICVMMDIAGSTDYSRRTSAMGMAKLMHGIYEAVNHAVLCEIFPYAYIHEICGDSLLLIVNAGFMVSHPEEASLIAMHAAATTQMQLDSKLAEYDSGMYARTGVSLGNVTAGVIDGRSFRVFGESVHLSQRLESVCPRGGIACADNFLDLLARQQDLTPSLEEGMGLRRKRSDLKGLGDTAYGVLDTRRCRELLGKSGRLLVVNNLSSSMRLVARKECANANNDS